MHHDAGIRQYVDRQMPLELRGWLDPQDVLQDVFFNAFRRSADFPAGDPEAELNWLLTVARNQLVDLLRRRRAAKRGGAGDEVRIGLDESLVAMLQELGTDDRTPSRTAAAREFFSEVEAALARLSADYARVIRLRHVEGLSEKETAAVMGRSEKAVEHLRMRGLAALRAEMRSVSLFV